MAISSTNAVAIYFNNEAVWNETPATPCMQQVRFTGETLTFGKKTVQSDTIRSDRMRDQMALVGFETKGDINYELSFFDFDAWLEAGMFSAWTGIKTLTGTTYALSATQLTDSANGLATIPVNSYIWLSGFTNPANNRRYRVTVSAAGALTLNPAPAATQSAGATITVSSGAVTVTTNTTVITIVVAGSAKTITFGGSGGFDPTTLGLVAGQFIALSGFAQAGNNGVKRIASVTSTVITVVDTMVDETVSTGTVTKYVGRRLRNGTTQRSFHIEKQFTDISQFMSFRGMRLSEFKMDTVAQEIIKGAFSFMGAKAIRAGTTLATTTIATNTSTVMTGSAHVGTIYQNGAAVAAGIKQITLDVNNNLRNSVQIGSLYPYGIGYGFQDVTGQVEAYFEDATLYDQLINHTSTELSWTVTDDSGNAYRFTLPSVLFTDGYPNASGGNADVMLPLSFQAIRNATYNCQIQIDELPSLT